MEKWSGKRGFSGDRHRGILLRVTGPDELLVVDQSRNVVHGFDLEGNRRWRTEPAFGPIQGILSARVDDRPAPGDIRGLAGARIVQGTASAHIRDVQGAEIDEGGQAAGLSEGEADAPVEQDPDGFADRAGSTHARHESGPPVGGGEVWFLAGSRPARLDRQSLRLVPMPA